MMQIKFRATEPMVEPPSENLGHDYRISIDFLTKDTLTNADLFAHKLGLGIQRNTEIKDCFINFTHYYCVFYKEGTDFTPAVVRIKFDKINEVNNHHNKSDFKHHNTYTITLAGVLNPYSENI